MKPFNLEKFLAGEPAVAVCGAKVVDFHYFKDKKKIIVDFERSSMLCTLNDDGALYRGAVSKYDLRMETKTKEVKIFLLKDRAGSYIAKVSDDYNTLEYWKKEPEFVKTITTTIEE